MTAKRPPLYWLPKRVSRSTAAYAHDVAMAGLAYGLALFLRVGTALFDHIEPAQFALGGALFVAVAAVVFRTQGLYRGVWRYASLNDMAALMRAATLTILVYMPVMFLVSRLEGLPRSFLVIAWFVLIFLLGLPRFAYRLLKDRRWDTILQREAEGPRIPVLLVGAGDGAELFIRSLKQRSHADYEVVGLLSEKSQRVGLNIHGKRVLGTIDQLPEVIERLTAQEAKPHRLVLTRDDVDRDMLRWLFEQADALGVGLGRMPRLTDFRHGKADALEVRPVAIEDLLGRPQARLDRDAMRALVAGRRVLVTGAGGSIGSELVRQVAALGPARLVLLEASEFALYSIDREILETFPAVARAPMLADVRDRRRIEGVFAAERPELVFHAAALKHVPIVEEHPLEGVLTNICGTRIVADACRAFGTRAMVLISTDKAVNPTNVMGATKRVAEQYCQALDSGHDGPRFMVVRFGNVLGSTGSVVPLFQRQLAAGGPITVTHPDMTRYFMTIREAVELVLQASALGLGSGRFQGHVFVLDMGKPVRIVDLARQMIRLAGLRPGSDIHITFTGLRPGEKLFEEIFHGAEPPVPTEQDGILVASPRTVPHDALSAFLDRMEACARGGDLEAVMEDLRALVPEYDPPAVIGAESLPGIAQR
ncbi:polysaccharide biosynthesis protein [Novispirillum sp. DQ9]|uniref:polysaccharide biosynthesis protein n=1 Tax=Novispirillum sp. DQ9 TaxID=3398612 RepID=UPI003C7BD372